MFAKTNDTRFLVLQKHRVFVVFEHTMIHQILCNYRKVFLLKRQLLQVFFCFFSDGGSFLFSTYHKWKQEKEQ